jgi:hypothetical protein
MLAPQASKIRSPRSPSIAIRAKSLMLVDSRAVVISASNCRWPRPRVGGLGWYERPADVVGGRVRQDWSMTQTR